MSKKHVFFLLGLVGVSFTPFLFDPASRLIQSYGPSWATVKITRVHHLTFWLLSFIWAVYFGLWVWKSDWSWFSAGNLKRKFFLILAAGTLFRLAVILFTNAPQVSDARDYDQMALGLAQTGTFQDNGAITAYRPIGYVAFLAGLYKIFGHTFLLPQLANIILDVLTLFLLWNLFSKWKNEKTALATCTILAFYLPEVYSTQYLLSEQLFVFLWMLCIYLFELHREKRLPAFLSGLSFGLAALVRPVVLLWAIIPAVTEVARRHWLRVALFILALILATAPWLYRNYLQFGVWKLSTNAGINFWMGANPQATGYYYMPPSPPFNFKNEIETEQRACKLGWEFIKNNPWDYLQLGLTKEAMIFGFDYGYIFPGLVDMPPYGQLVWAVLGQSMWWVVLFVGGVNAVFILFDSRKRGAAGSLLPLWTLLYWAAAHFFFIGVDRYHHPVVPFFAYLAVLKFNEE